MVHELVICRVEPEPRWHLNLALHLPSLPSPPLLCLFLSVVLDLLSRCSWSQVQEEAGSFSGFLECRLHHRSLTARQGFIYRDTLEGLREASRRQYPAWIYPYFNSDTWVIKGWRGRGRRDRRSSRGTSSSGQSGSDTRPAAWFCHGLRSLFCRVLRVWLPFGSP